jgi:hypothetical protein
MAHLLQHCCWTRAVGVCWRRPSCTTSPRAQQLCQQLPRLHPHRTRQQLARLRCVNCWHGTWMGHGKPLRSLAHIRCCYTKQTGWVTCCMVCVCVCVRAAVAFGVMHQGFWPVLALVTWEVYKFQLHCALVASPFPPQRASRCVRLEQRSEAWI